MTQNRVPTKGSEAMRNVAEHYASELNAQFRTLNHFIVNTGEIGRAHEAFLRGILARFLPKDIRISSGFVASPTGTSSQQDILLHRNEYSTLFEIGDCVVIDYDAFIGTIEVKTDLYSSEMFLEAVKKQARLRKQMCCSGLYSIYAWRGISYDTALEALWNFVRTDPSGSFDYMPDIVCVLGKYFLRANRDGVLETPPYKLWRVEDGGITEGEALLGLAASVWKFGLHTEVPWWLLSWHDHMGIVAGKSQEVPWPDELMSLIKADIASK